MLRQAGHQGQLRFRGFNQEMHYGQVLGGPSGAVPGLLRLAPVRPRARTPCWARGRTATCCADGDPVIVDLVGGHEGYLADQTRTFVVGRQPPTCASAYDVAVEILRAAEAALRPGAVAGGAVRAGRAAWRPQAGLGEHFMGAGAERVRFLGHGVGMEIDELPMLAPGFDDAARPRAT